MDGRNTKVPVSDHNLPLWYPTPLLLHPCLLLLSRQPPRGTLLVFRHDRCSPSRGGDVGVLRGPIALEGKLNVATIVVLSQTEQEARYAPTYFSSGQARGGGDCHGLRVVFSSLPEDTTRNECSTERSCTSRWSVSMHTVNFHANQSGKGTAEDDRGLLGVQVVSGTNVGLDRFTTAKT